MKVGEGGPLDEEGTYNAATPIFKPAVLGTAGIGLANDAMIAASIMRQTQQPATPMIMRGLRPTRSIMHAPMTNIRLGLHFELTYNMGHLPRKFDGIAIVIQPHCRTSCCCVSYPNALYTVGP